MYLVDPSIAQPAPSPKNAPSDRALSLVHPPTEQPAPSTGTAPSDRALSLDDPPTEQPASSPGNAPSNLAPPDVAAFCGMRLLELEEKVSLF